MTTDSGSTPPFIARKSPSVMTFCDSPSHLTGQQCNFMIGETLKMFNWHRERKLSNPSEPDTKIKKLSTIFRSIESTDDCLNLLYQEGILNNKITIKEVELFEKVCKNLRAQGLDLEPNIIGRTIANSILDRHLARSASIRFAAFDSDFLRLIKEADTARDSAEFSKAQYHYWQALELFPAHAGYRVQYAHCLKEQGLIKEALVEYIDAYLYGEPLKNIEQHALFVADKINLQAQVSALLKRKSSKKTCDESSLDCYVSRKDVNTIVNLLLGRPTPSDEIIKYMLECDNKRHLIYNLLVEDDFSRFHLETLILLNETK